MSDAIKNVLASRDSQTAEAWDNLRAVMLGEERPGVNLAHTVAILGMPDADLLEMTEAAGAYNAMPDTAAEMDAAHTAAADAATDSARHDAETERLVASLRATRAPEAERRQQAIRDTEIAIESVSRRHAERKAIEARHPYLFHKEFPLPSTRVGRAWYARTGGMIDNGLPVSLPAGMGRAFFAECVQTVAERIKSDRA